MIDRDDGYYWVWVFPTDKWWRPGNWNKERQLWLLIGSDKVFSEDDLYKVGENIGEPLTDNTPILCDCCLQPIVDDRYRIVQPWSWCVARRITFSSVFEDYNKERLRNRNYDVCCLDCEDSGVFYNDQYIKTARKFADKGNSKWSPLTDIKLKIGK